MIGSTMGTRQELADLLAFCRHIGLRPHIGLELVVDHAEEALGAMLEGETTSRIDLTR
jgi:D-arabinose 1-dehydrogenase-like Zn-dependent alcohol dehydrogenase